MCLAVPMQVVLIEGRRARVRSGGVEMTAALDLVDGVQVGDYVIIHAGYAIQSLSAEEAKETLAIFERLAP
jgi:hydrogenase expression/formation protein HypC